MHYFDPPSMTSTYRRVGSKPVGPSAARPPEPTIAHSIPTPINCEGQPDFVERDTLLQVYLCVPQPQDFRPTPPEEKHWRIFWYVGPDNALELVGKVMYVPVRYIELRVGGTQYVYPGALSDYRAQEYAREGRPMSLGALRPDARKRLEQLAAATPVRRNEPGAPWTDKDWFKALLASAVKEGLFSAETVANVVAKAEKASNAEDEFATNAVKDKGPLPPAAAWKPSFGKHAPMPPKVSV